MTAGRASGMAATAKETAVRNISNKPSPRKKPMAKITAHTNKTT